MSDFVPTALGQKVLRVRLSLKETQKEFSDRFRVSTTTVHKWERGTTARMQRIFREILDRLAEKLREEGRLLPEEAITLLYQEEAQREIEKERRKNLITSDTAENVAY